VNLRPGGSCPQPELVGASPARRLEGAELPVAAVTQVWHHGRWPSCQLSG